MIREQRIDWDALAGKRLLVSVQNHTDGVGNSIRTVYLLDDQDQGMKAYLVFVECNLPIVSVEEK